MWESKTADEFSPLAFVRQAKLNAAVAQGPLGDVLTELRAVPVVVYWPRGTGAILAR